MAAAQVVTPASLKLKTQNNNTATESTVIQNQDEQGNDGDTVMHKKASQAVDTLCGNGSDSQTGSNGASTDSGVTSPSPQTMPSSGPFLPGISPSPPSSDNRVQQSGSTAAESGISPPSLSYSGQQYSSLATSLSPPEHLARALPLVGSSDGDYDAWRSTTGAFSSKLSLFGDSSNGGMRFATPDGAGDATRTARSGDDGRAVSPPPFLTSDHYEMLMNGGTQQSQFSSDLLSDATALPISSSAGCQNTKCPLCMESYNDPKVLACFHSFCRDCLGRTVDNAEHKVICPLCQAETQLCADMGVDSLLHDYGLENMIKNGCVNTPATGAGTNSGSRMSPVSASSSPGLDSNSSSDSGGPTCTGCKSKESNAVAFCQDCTNLLCANCVMAHQFMHCFEGHRVQDLTDMDKRHVKRLIAAVDVKPVKCYQHRSEPLRYFCFTCNIPVCRECVSTEHPKGVHKFEPITDISDQQLEHMEALLKTGRQKQRSMVASFRNVDGLQQRLNMTTAKVQADINETARFLQQLIEEQRAQAIKETEQMYQTKHMQLNLIDKKTQQMADKLSHTIEFTNRLLRYASPAEVLVFKQLLETRMHVILNFEPDTGHLQNLTDIDFVPIAPQQARAAIMSAFGYVKGGPMNFDSLKQAGLMPPTPIGRPPSRQRLQQQVSYSGTTGTTSVSAAAINTGSSARSSGIGSQLSPQSAVHIGNAFPHPFGDMSGPNQGAPLNQSLGNVSKPSTIIPTPMSHDPSMQAHPIDISSFSAFSEPHGGYGSGGQAPNTFSYEKWSSGQDSYPVSMNDASNPNAYNSPQDTQLIDMTNRLAAASGLFPPRSQIKRQKMIYHCKFGEFGVMEGQFTEPSGVAVNAQNDIIVADTNNHRIQVFDKDGRFKFQFGECGKRDAQLLYPNRVAVNRVTGDIIVTERSPTHQIQVYNQYGHFVRKFGANILQHPRGVCVDNKGHIVVIECKVMRIIMFDTNGNVLTKFSCSRYLEFPNGVCTNDKNEIFVSDNRAHSVKVFNYEGQFLRQIGGEGITNYPIGVGINHNGEVVVADNHNNFNLSIFQQDGTLVNALESKVKHAQCFDVSLIDDGFCSSVVLASKDYRLYLYRYMNGNGQQGNNSASNVLSNTNNSGNNGMMHSCASASALSALVAPFS